MAIKKSNNDINARMFYALRVSEESRVPFLFISAPGMGKSTTVEMFAEIQGYELVILRGNSTSPEEVMGYDVCQPGISTAVHLRPTWYDALLENDKQGKKTLLFLDEITTCPSHVQAALLHLILERKVGNERIPGSTLIVSAGNYAQSLGSTFDLLAPLMNRFCIFNVVPDPSDVHMFLSKYEGAMAGKMVNVIAEKTEQLKKMNSKAIQVDSEEQHNKISEYIERGFNDVVDALMNSGQKVVDLRVTDLQGLYQDTDNDNTLKGFVTPRTLCFLRDATISAYFAFGKDGILSKNYHLLVEGLCGIGLSRKNGNGEVVVTEIAKEFENQMKLVVTEIDKMSNDKLPVYNQYFIDLVNQNRDKKGNPKLNHESITAAYNKIKEMLADKDVQGIERPIESQNLEPLITGAWAFMAEISSSQVDNTKNIEDYLSLEKLSSIITQWNSCAVLLSQLKSIIKNDKYGYTDKTKSDFSDTIEKIRKYSFAINIVDRYMKQHNPQAQSLLPALNTDFIDN
jgi:hypothetical protein